MLTFLTIVASAVFIHLVLGFLHLGTVVAMALVAAFVFLPPFVEDVTARMKNRRPSRDSENYERQEFCCTFLIAISLIYFLPDLGNLHFIAILVFAIAVGKSKAQLTLGEPGIKKTA